MPRVPRFWTVEEDAILRGEMATSTAADGKSIDWCRIAAKLPGRTNKDCRKRWCNAVVDGINKGQWTKLEDERLKRGVESHGQKKWPQIADIVDTRSADQCAKRWQQSLDPELDHSDWSDDDNQLLLQIVEEVGRQWTLIQGLHFSGRSKNAIKNRYTVLTRKPQNHGPEGQGSSLADASQKHSELNDSQYSSGDEDEIDDVDNMETDINPPNAEGIETHATPVPIATSAARRSETDPGLSSDWLYGETMSLNTHAEQRSDHFNMFGSTGAIPDLAFGGIDLEAPGPAPSSDAWLECSPGDFLNVTSSPANHGPNGAGSICEGNNFFPEPFHPSPGLAGSIPGAGNPQESNGKIHFTVTMNSPSVQTMQSLMEIAIQTRARFRIERE
ncbi:MAG: hypothetical protein Q9219_003930 [cf. Caloplaca sp. 3 TL-2023]